MFTGKTRNYVVAGVAALAIATGGVAIGHATAGDGSSGSASAAQIHPGFGPRAGGQFPQGGGQPPQAGFGAAPQAQSGQIPQGWSPGSGTIITGAAADKAKAAALAAGYKGTVNRVLQLSDGSYAVHFIATPAPHHVFVSQDFEVTGAA
jgi:hypothetical protein